MARRNPPRTVADPVAARELFLYIINDGDLYRQNISMVLKNLQKKIAKGNYDPKKALKLWGYSAEWGAQKYARDFGGTWHSMFNASTRREVAKQLADYYEEALRETNPRRRKRTRRNAGSRFTRKDLRELVADLNQSYKLTDKTGKLRAGGAYGMSRIEWVYPDTSISDITGFGSPREVWGKFTPEYHIKYYKQRTRERKKFMRGNPRSRTGRYPYDPAASTIIMVPPSMRTTRKMKRKTKKTKKVKRNACSTKDNPPVPKGKRKGEVFTRKGKKYRVVSFTNSKGTRVRYARKIKNTKRKKR